ncbi:MAG: hypothetical protein CME27_02190 [Gemmatimonadetes bacterium]|nr:hypothetical protein [Gemmatimonadota bacterium]|tara:strand:+ start:23 stop:742 length:720 start_codon:yes stop_codon:yes gene_type:complete
MGKSSIITEAADLPLEARRVHKSFKGGDGSELQVLTGVDLRLARNETVAVIGASGAGKSTLLHILGGLDRPTKGNVLVEGASLTGLEDEALAAVRNRRIGFVFQFHHLLREFTAVENVMMPALIAGLEEHEARTKAELILADVGLSERLRHKPSSLSGGEQQRVAVARSLVNGPVVLLADEPSGNLDADTSAALHDLLFDLQESVSLSILVVTHNLDLASRADRVLVMEKGGLHLDATG